MPLALIAEDEPLLAVALQQALAEAWPALTVAEVVGDGDSVVPRALALQPEVLLLDIRLPGQSGLAAASALLDVWPQDVPFPLLVFVTAYDQYAVQAFEAQAVDYLLKPVQPARLAQTVQRLQRALATQSRGGVETALQQAASQLRALLAQTEPAASGGPYLERLQAGVGSTVHFVPLADVLYLEAADKYVRVVTATQEWLIRQSLRTLLPQLDPAQFWQVHRGTVVQAAAVQQAERDEAGRMWLRVAGRPERLAVSRLWAHRFRPM